MSPETIVEEFREIIEKQLLINLKIDKKSNLYYHKWTRNHPLNTHKNYILQNNLCMPMITYTVWVAGLIAIESTLLLNGIEVGEPLTE